MKITKLKGAFLFGYFLLQQVFCTAQAIIPNKDYIFSTPQHYLTSFTSEAPTIDGNLNESAWQAATWTNNFIDIEGKQKPKPTWNTRVKMLWNDTCLFIAAELQDPHVWATLKQHDTIVYYDHDFEIFIDPDNDTHNYYEIEVNAYNTIFDLFMTKPYRNGGRAIIPWQAVGMRSAVQVQGTLNNPNDTDKGWTVEMAIPLRTLTSTGRSNRIEEETNWRINFSRVQWDAVVQQGKYVKVTGPNGKPLPEHNWVWSPQGLINMHFPELWGYLYFTRKPVTKKPTSAFTLPYAEKLKQHLWQIYYLQKEYFRKNRRYAASLSDLGIKNNQVKVDSQMNQIRLEANTYQFMAFIKGNDPVTYSLNQDGLVQTIKE
ncbi:carbohydrate-binding family 9-like protein [Adhaeribacter radiodurans]|uniref:Carbohydrate-binding family 9-like protein n=1 Tax=Adhaeribacter radiodurans TaxID=2745197 RepID=A0A7L7L6T2_9BACT|nr:carbohydrate-binding family 9-like protein [Adhaeribacter radiodurans]QMU28552.1 carbohydrate-binding family 9-like protein [Adhaeribacter radiodurans]